MGDACIVQSIFTVSDMCGELRTALGREMQPISHNVVQRTAFSIQRTPFSKLALNAQAISPNGTT